SHQSCGRARILDRNATAPTQAAVPHQRHLPLLLLSQVERMPTKSHIIEAERTHRGFAPRDPQLDRKVRDLQAPRVWASAQAFALDWLVIVIAASSSWGLFVAIGITPVSVVAYLIACLVIGSRQKGLENLMHEGT